MSFWFDLKDAVSSFPFYKSASSRSLSQAMKFLLGLVLLLTVVLSIRLSFSAFYGINAISDWMIQSLPEITVTQGQASSAVQQPFKIEALDKQFIFILDTTGVTQEIPNEYPSGILVMQKKVLFKQDAFQKRVYDLSQVSGLVVNKETIGKLEQVVKTWIIPLLLLGLFIYLFIARLIQVLFFTLMSLVINAAGGIGLSYKALFVIGIYALVPCSFLGLLVALIGLPVPWFAPVYLTTYLAYLLIGILQCKKETP